MTFLPSLSASLRVFTQSEQPAMRLLLALAALLSPASVYAPNAKELTTSTLNVLLKRTDLLVVQYHQTHASDAALGAVAERLGRAGRQRLRAVAAAVPRIHKAAGRAEKRHGQCHGPMARGRLSSGAEAGQEPGRHDRLLVDACLRQVRPSCTAPLPSRTHTWLTRCLHV